MRGPLNQDIDDMRARRLKHRRPRGPLGFQVLVALHTAVDIVDSIAVFPDQFHAVDAAIALIEQGQIVDVAIGHRNPHKPLGLAVAEHGKKLYARRRHCRHTYQPTEHGGHEPTPP